MVLILPMGFELHNNWYAAGLTSAASIRTTENLASRKCYITIVINLVGHVTVQLSPTRMEITGTTE